MLGFYLPILVLISRWFYRLLLWPKRAKKPLIVVCVTLAFFAPVFDVMQTGLDMHYYCNNEQGEHIYKKATTNSLYGEHIISSDFLEAGFDYVEKLKAGQKLVRIQRQDNEIVQTAIDDVSSEYEYIYETIHLENNVDLINRRVENRKTGQILGETKKFRTDGGRLDDLTPSLGPVLFWCSKPVSSSGAASFVLQFLKPTKS